MNFECGALTGEEFTLLIDIFYLYIVVIVVFQKRLVLCYYRPYYVTKM